MPNNNASLLSILFPIAWLAAVGCLPLGAACTEEDAATQAFRSCLLGTAPSCALSAAGIHVVCSPLNIDNSYLSTISGPVGDTSPADTTLQRGFTGSGGISTWPIMYLTSAAVTGLTIEYLTFDGNRWAFGAPPSSGFSTAPNLSCLQGNFCGNDLDLTQAVIATVWYVNFIRA